MSLFHIQPGQEYLFPTSFTNAAFLATAILRSTFHTDTFCQLYSKEDGAHHIDKKTLESVLSKNEIFMVDKIRRLEFIDKRACTIPEQDPFKIFMNVCLLLEMKDREKEQTELELKPLEVWPDVLIMQPFWKLENAYELNTGHDCTFFNSLVYIAQSENKTQRAEKYNKKDYALDWESKRVEDDTNPGAKRAKTELSKPSTMSVTQKNVLMLTILLVHEAEHLLLLGISAVLVHGKPPPKKFTPFDSHYFTDVGHLMERHLYGYSIGHAYSEHWPAAFAIDEVLGSLHQQSDGLQYVLQPVPAFLALLDKPYRYRCDSHQQDEIEITREVIALEPTGSGAFIQPKQKIKASTSCRAATSSGSPESGVQEALVQSSSEKSTSDTSETELAEDEKLPAYFTGKS